MPGAHEHPTMLCRRPRPSRPRPGTRLVVALAAGALAALALFVVVALPDYVRPPGQTAPTVAPAPRPITDTERSVPSETRAASADQAEAERLLSAALRRLARLEGEGARIWGIELVAAASLPSAEAELAHANTLYDRHRFVESLPVFRQAIAALDRLGESKPERLQRALSAGREALDRGDSSLAVRQLEIAVALAPDDARATAALGQARKLPELLASIAQGEAAEATGDLQQARAAYREAVSLDPGHEPVRAHVVRVEGMIAAQDYKAAVSEVLAQLNLGDTRAASAALERARRADPNGPQLGDLRQRVQAVARVAALERLRGRAAELERQEKWEDAVRLYDQALALDRQAAFATHGRAHAQQLTQLHTAIDRYLSEPARLQSSDPLAHAKTLIVQAEVLGEGGELLSAKRRQLAQLVARAQAPVAVLLVSDGHTEVIVHRVGRLGTFDSRRLDLPPGRYVAVGSRAGFRDVRVTFDVTPAADRPPIAIRCVEPVP